MIGGSVHKTSLPLYKKGKPVWRQEIQTRANEDLKNIHIFIPKHVDLVAIKIGTHKKNLLPFALPSESIFKRHLMISREVYISGYPYGYSSLNHTPEPIVLRRMVASNFFSRPHLHLTDGFGSPGMSGSPVYYIHENKFRLWGVYTGALYPDYEHNEVSEEKRAQKSDKFSALGIVLQFSDAKNKLFPSSNFKSANLLE